MKFDCELCPAMRYCAYSLYLIKTRHTATTTSARRGLLVGLSESLDESPSEPADSSEPISSAETNPSDKTRIIIAIANGNIFLFMVSKKRVSVILTHGLGHITLCSRSNLFGLGLQVSDNVGGLLQVCKHLVKTVL